MSKLLSSQERSVLFALAEDAGRTDAEIADRIGMKETTAGRHRRNLQRDGHFYFANYPDLSRLGIEFLATVFGPTNPAVPIDRKNETFKAFFERSPEFFEVADSECLLMAYGAFRSMSDFMLFQDRFGAFFRNPKWSKGEFTKAVFPFEISRCNYLPNYAPCLHRIFGLDIEDPASRPMMRHRTDPIELSKPEARIIVELLERPMASDQQIAQKLRRSRQSVTQIRNGLFSKGLLTPVAVPTLNSDDCGAVAYVHMKFDSSTSFEKKASIAGDAWWTQSIFALERDAELFAAYVFRDFQEYSALLPEFLGPFQESDLLSSEPTVLSVPMWNEDDIIYSEFAPMMKRNLA